MLKLVKTDEGPKAWYGAPQEIHKQLDALFAEHARSSFIYALEEATVGAPIVWYPNSGYERGSKPPSDPLTIGMSFYDGTFRLEFSLRDTIDGYLDDLKDDGSFGEGLALFRDGLRALAGEIDEALNAEKSK